MVPFFLRWGRSKTHCYPRMRNGDATVITLEIQQTSAFWRQFGGILQQRCLGENYAKKYTIVYTSPFLICTEYQRIQRQLSAVYCSGASTARNQIGRQHYNGPYFHHTSKWLYVDNGHHVGHTNLTQWNSESVWCHLAQSSNTKNSLNCERRQSNGKQSCDFGHRH